MYKNQIKGINSGRQTIAPRRKEDPEKENVDLRMSINLQLGHNEEYPKEKIFLHHKNEEIEFLWHNYK